MENLEVDTQQKPLLIDESSEEDLADRGEQNGRWRETPRTIFIFFMFGFLVCFLAGTVLTSAEDILQNDSKIPTGVIWIMYTVPFLLFSFLVSYIFDRTPTGGLVVSFFPLMVVGIGLICLVDNEEAKLAGVFLIGTTDCVSEVVAVALTAYFDRVTVMAFCVGSGLSYVMGPLYYTAMTSWLYIHPKIVLSTLLLHPTVFLLCYLCLEKRREKFRSEVFISQDQKKLERIEHLSLKSKLRNTCAFLPKLLQLVLCFTFNDLVVSGVTTTIAFKNSLITPADHYKYYLVASFGGLFVGRSYLGVIELIKPGLADKILINRTWVFVVVTTGHVVLFVLESLFRFLPNIALTMCLVFTLGFSSEAIYANISVILGELEDYRLREIVQGLSVYGVGLGNLLGSILSGLIEEPLVKHCLKTTDDSSLCFTRNHDVNYE